MITFEHTPWSYDYKSKPTKPGCWNYNSVTVYKDGVEYYNYDYEYSGRPPFYPFLYKGEWYALYSTDYTATRVLKLSPIPEDWCGEEGDTWGFCPVEMFVEKFKLHTYDYLANYKEGKKVEPYLSPDLRFLKEDEFNSFDIDHWEKTKKFLNNRISDLAYYPVGFISGCHWGDDHTWKIQMIDFSELDKRIITRREIFGYIEQCSLSLKDSVKVSCSDRIRTVDEIYDIKNFFIDVTHTQTFNITPGKDTPNE